MIETILVLLLILIGFTLVLLEIFFIPGINVFGFLGGFLVLAGVGMAYYYHGFQVALYVLILCGLLGIILARIVIKSPAWKKLVLSDNDEESPQSAANPTLFGLIGQRGTTNSPLRPSGSAFINGDKYSVVTRGEFLNENSPIEVIHVEGNQIIVKALSEN